MPKEETDLHGRVVTATETVVASERQGFKHDRKVALSFVGEEVSRLDTPRRCLSKRGKDYLGLDKILSILSPF
jgi:hypothetical protein